MSTTKAVAIAAPKETELAKLAKTAAALVPKAQAFKVTDAASKAKAIEIIKEIKTRAKLVEDLKAELIAPAKKALDEATKKFTGPAKLYKQAEDVLKRAIIAFDSEEARAKALAASAASSAAKKGDADQAHALLMLATSVPEKTEGVSEVKYWEVEIVDKAKIPYQYMEVNEQALLAVVRADSTASVPGVRFVQKTRLQVRT
jgi:hypothetical protein